MKYRIPHKSLVINLFILMFIVLELLFVIKPNIVIMDAIQESINDQVLEVNRQLELGQTTKKIEEDLEKIRPFLEKLSQNFLHETDQLTFITLLENLGQKHNLDLKFQLPDIPENKKGKNEATAIPLSLDFTGTYADTILFLIELQNLDFYINIIDLSLNSRGLENGTSIITTKLRANTYWQE